MKLALLSGLISLLITIMGLWCYQTAVGEPLGCVPFLLPNFLVASYFDKVFYPKEIEYSGILIGSFIEYFIAGYIASWILKIVKN